MFDSSTPASIEQAEEKHRIRIHKDSEFQVFAKSVKTVFFYLNT